MPVALVALCKHFCPHIFITPLKSEAQIRESSGVPCPYYGPTRQQPIFAFGTWKARNVGVWTNIKHPPHTSQPWNIFLQHSPVLCSRQCPRSHNHELVKVTHSAHDRGWCHHQLLDQQEQWQFPESSSHKDCKTGWQRKYPGIYTFVSNPLSDRLTVLCLFYTYRNRETYCIISCELTEIHYGCYSRDKYQF